jgi:DNA-binding MarR family transcriptional regulator
MRYSASKRTARITGVQELIIDEVCRNGGEITGLYPLAADLNIDYSHAYNMVNRLAAAGLLEVRRVKPADGRSTKGRALVMRVAGG